MRNGLNKEPFVIRQFENVLIRQWKNEKPMNGDGCIPLPNYRIAELAH